MDALKPATSYISTSLDEPVRIRMAKEGLGATAPQTIPQYFNECWVKYANLPALAFEESVRPNDDINETQAENHWKTVTYAEYANNVEQAALLLMHVGLKPRTCVGILSMNCPEWLYTELGAMKAGGVVAGIYPSNSAEAVYHCLYTSQATVCVVDDAQQMLKVRSVQSRLPSLRAVIQLHGPYDDFVGNETGYFRWKDLMEERFDNELRVEMMRREQDIGANECAILIYTSGTVGLPKGAMISHDSVLFDLQLMVSNLPNIENGKEVIVSYLPLNHIAAQIVDVFVSLATGACVYFADRNALKGTLVRTLLKARPTLFFGVPRVYEKLKDGLVAAEEKSSRLMRCITGLAQNITRQYYLDIVEKKKPSHLKYWLATAKTSRFKQVIGFDRVKIFFIAGAPTTRELKLYFFGLDVPLNELYGLSETGGAVNMHKTHVDLTTVGSPFDCIEEKIINPNSEGHGEICVRSRTCFMGYLGEPEKTKETITEDGWLHTGDIGYLDDDGNLVVSGRLKELIITAGGENIAPVLIEDAIKEELPCISHAMVVGDMRKYLTVLLTFKTDFDASTGKPLDSLSSQSVEWFASMGLPYKLLSDALKISPTKMFVDENIEVKPDARVIHAIEAAIKRANLKSISNAHRVQKFSLLPHDFSLATEELGPTLKLRRSFVLRKYATIIDRMYNN